MSTEAQDQIAELFADFAGPDSPGGIAAVIRDGEVIFDHAFGQASIEHAVANGRETVFYIASTSKQFVAASIAILEAEGKLGLEDDIRDYIPELSVFDPPIRIHNLLHHTSGLRDKYALAAVGGLGESSYATDAGSLQLITGQRSLNFPLGSRMMYSNSNYFLLAQTVERISGQGFADFTRERIFEPAGMTNTQFRQDPYVVITHRASGYRRAADGTWRVAEYTMSSLGPGGVVTTVEDLARWSTVFFGGKTVEPADLADRLTRTRPLTDGSDNNYGMGLMVGEFRGVPIISHAGGVGGFAAEMVHFPEHDLSVACLANTSAVSAAVKARHVAALWLDLPEPEAAAGGARAGNQSQERPLLPADDRFAGVWLSADGEMVLRIERNEEDALVAKIGGMAAPLEPAGGARLRGPAGTEIELVDGVIELHSPGGSKPTRFEAVGEATDQVPTDLSGTYKSEELDVCLTVSADSGALTICWPRAQPLELVPLGEDLFVAKTSVLEFSMDVPLRVLRGADSRVEALSISASRALHNRFDRVP